MEFHQIRYFLVAADTLNFTKAAERCHVSQPALTRAVRKLEDELGGPLFRREGRLTQLTDLGRKMQEHLSRVEDSSRKALDVARKLQSLDAAPLDLGLMCTVGTHRIVPFLKSFQKTNPGIKVSLVGVTPNDVADGLLSGRLDAAFLGLPVQEPDRFDSIDLYFERMMVTFSRDHRFSKMPSVPFDELNDEKYLDRLNCEMRDLITADMEKSDIKPHVVCCSERDDWVQRMIEEGMGIGIMPELSIDIQELQSRPFSNREYSRVVKIATIAGRLMSPATLALLDLVKNYNWGFQQKESGPLPQKSDPRV